MGTEFGAECCHREMVGQEHATGCCGVAVRPGASIGLAGAGAESADARLDRLSGNPGSADREDVAYLCAKVKILERMLTNNIDALRLALKQSGRFAGLHEASALIREGAQNSVKIRRSISTSGGIREKVERATNEKLLLDMAKRVREYAEDLEATENMTLEEARKYLAEKRAIASV